MRIVVGGRGEPIEEFALPDAFIDPDFPILTFDLANGSSFNVADYVGLGYTNYDVFCIGAAGGKGGGFPLNLTYIRSYGGAGGGGGMQKVSGLLADLPSSVPVVVGSAGAHGSSGNFDFIDKQNPSAPPPYIDNPAYVAPTDGSNGGASSFNGTLCRASGGKGGKKAPSYKELMKGLSPTSAELAHTRLPGGDGGDGGKGGQTTAGGGGLGAISTIIYDHAAYGEVLSTAPHGEDGSWDGSIGEGGGGGRGGTYLPATGQIYSFNYYESLHAATNGGDGSFSFGDTSVRGSGGIRSSDNTNKTILPGAGGGAKLAANLMRGSYAPGYTPNGAVILRISKVS